MKKLVICQGLPASGKSTYAKELVTKEKFKRINRDELRAMLDCSVWSKANEKIVSDARDQMMKNSLENGFNVIIDDTNLVESTVKHLIEIAREVGDVEVIVEPFNVSVEECLARNSKREGIARVPDSVILGMSKLIKEKQLSRTSIKFPALFKISNLIQDESLPKAIICEEWGLRYWVILFGIREISKVREVLMREISLLSTKLLLTAGNIFLYSKNQLEA